MSQTEILAALPHLTPAELTELIDRLFELQKQELLHGETPTPEERDALNQEWAEFKQNGNFGRPWRESLAAIRSAL